MRVYRLIVAIAALWMAPDAPAESGKLMHCFAFTAVEGATEGDWKAWQAGTAGLTKKVPGLKHVCYGKLVTPFAQIGPEQRFDAETTRKFRTGEALTIGVKRVERQYGACFEFRNKAAFDAYGNPAHDAWTKLYERVRADGTATYQILAQ